MVETVLCYLFKDDKVLMLKRNKKENDYNHGKYIGVGGHIEDDETIEYALIREVLEETGYHLLSFKKRGCILFMDNEYNEVMHLYTSNEFFGDEIECSEGELEWVSKDKIFDLELFEGDKVFLDMLLNSSEFIKIMLYYEKGEFKGWDYYEV